MVEKCPECKALIKAENCVFCGWSGVLIAILQIQECHFKGDGKCRMDNKQKIATVRINDYWICNWHYEHGYGHNDEARTEREAIQKESNT